MALGQVMADNDALMPGAMWASDLVAGIETHGIDLIAVGERRGHPRELFAVWAASNVTYLYIVIGGALMLLGLGVWQALTVVFAGNAFWALVGLLAVSGPASGAPSEVVTRAIYGIRGNRLQNAVLEWGIGVAYEALNLSIAALAAFALVGRLGGHAGTPTRVAIVLGTALASFTISVYGHATIVRLSRWFTVGLLVCCAVLAFFVLRHADLGYVGPSGSAMHGPELWAAISVGFTLVAAAPLSWGTGADYSRYLPANTSPRAVAFWTAIGGLCPALILGALGVLAGTVIDMSDPQTSLRIIVPSWFYPVLLLVIMLGAVTNNVLTAYSTGLSLQAVGVQWKRSTTVVLDAAVAISITCYALFVSNFLSTLNDMLALSVAFLGPALAVYGTDIVIRRNRYDELELDDETPCGPCWYQHGVNLGGVGALLIGSAVALLGVNTALVVGPLSHALDGADISALAGPTVASIVYAVAARHQRRHATRDAVRRGCVCIGSREGTHGTPLG
jgi:nucleobase:cation symporter-1, NCS1 family